LNACCERRQARRKHKLSPLIIDEAIFNNQAQFLTSTNATHNHETRRRAAHSQASIRTRRWRRKHIQAISKPYQGCGAKQNTLRGWQQHNFERQRKNNPRSQQSPQPSHSFLTNCCLPKSAIHKDRGRTLLER
jgi:hypothetical protein